MSDGSLVYGDARKPCCRDDANLGVVERVNASLTFRRCQVCGCRHFEAVADVGALGLHGTSLG